MKIKWDVTAKDAAAVRDLVGAQRRSSFVEHRVRTNVSTPGPRRLTEARFWKCMVACMLSSQAPAGPGSHLNRFLRTEPFPLDLEVCANRSGALRGYVRRVFGRHRGIRYPNRCSDWIVENYRWLKRGGWAEVLRTGKRLSKCRRAVPSPAHVPVEREGARMVDLEMKGFGPKQARNLWQTLGLTRYEIPLDSRVMAWLNDNVLAEPVSPAPLGDPGFYELVLDGVQALCHRARVLPCVFDAAVFALRDPDWPAESLEWC